MKNIVAPSELVKNLLRSIADLRLEHESSGEFLDESEMPKGAWVDVVLAKKKLEDLIQVAEKDSRTVEAYYRCTSCAYSWENSDGFGETLDCEKCEEKDIEPYFTCGKGDYSNLTAVQAEAQQELEFPVASQRGEYQFEVVRSEHSVATVTVNSCGPANAHLNALEESGSVCFSSGPSAEYEVQNQEGFNPIKIGDKFYWNDPDKSGESDCSGNISVTKICNDKVVGKLESGGLVEALYSELS